MMKTWILKTDVRIQMALVVLTTALVIFMPLRSLTNVMQVVVLAYQMVMTITHLALEHKSAGYSYHRKNILAAFIVHTVCYYAFILLSSWDALQTPLMLAIDFIARTLVMQGFVYAYFIVSNNELTYLEKREFFILK